ncbi:histone H3-K4 methyltransferase Set1 [Lojkania enalia]|uniref:Histone-lysine N-methyltransferase, H3 lysine-4 specific n=1 Tax=Lojkania enalia TaxID=147567 RepID=A0A9P4K7Q4_9PLEO|nr:histone H3-K4 methyltransferase Set1 [Didymosphaeria enalia]
MSRASAAENPDLPSPPLTLHNQRSAHNDSPRRAGSHRADSSVPCLSPSSAYRSSAHSRLPHSGNSNQNNSSSSHSPAEDGIGADDLLNRIGSASSLASSTSSIFSAPPTKMSYGGQTQAIHALTPLTSSDSSPPGKPFSPRSAKPSMDTMNAAATPLQNAIPNGIPKAVSETITPVHTPPENRRQARPTSGSMGQRIVFDPALHKKKGAATTYKDIYAKGDPSPPPDPRLAIAGYTTGNYVIKTVNSATPKTKLRITPYIGKTYTFDQRISCGPGPATQVVVTGFDPLIPESQIRGFFTTFGEVESVKNQVDPNNGSPLGICLVRFRESPATRRLPAVKASASAKKAEQEGTGQRIGLQAVKVQLDREGRRCNKLVERAVERSRREEEKLQAKLVVKSVTPSTPTATGSFDLPANVPKGPSGRGARIPIPAVMPAHSLSRKHQLSYLVEQEPLKPRMRRKPYIFIAKGFVPVLGTTIEHLKKRLKSYHWKSVRCDNTGYFITFEESKRGEDETVRCYNECHMSALFTYTMNMECNQYGDPDYERSPSPERVAADRKRKAEQARIEQEEEDDLEFEKAQRADALDPVHAACEILKQEMKEKLLSDIKTRVGMPALLDFMAPDRQAPKRRKLNIPDPRSKEESRPPTYFGHGLDSPIAGTPNSRAAGYAGRFGRKALAPFDANRSRGKKQPKLVNAFADERRKITTPKKSAVRGMHRVLLDMKDDESDDDDGSRSALTRDTEDLQSRPISRATTPDVEDEDDVSSRARRFKRRRIEAGWGDPESDDEMMDDSHARTLLAHLIHKDPENMAEKELEQVLAILPRSSPIWKKADKALKGLRRFQQLAREADEIFGLEPSAEDKLEPELIIAKEEPVQTIEKDIVKAPKKKVGTAKPKKEPKKSKKQALEEVKAPEVVVTELDRMEEDLPGVEEPKSIEEIHIPESESPVEEERSSVQWSSSTSQPRRTVEDDFSVVMDIDGWQDVLKDEEDLVFLKKALEDVPTARVGDAESWAWKQKQIKHLNRPGEEGVSRSETRIEGYYVPNPTGCARTEGVKKMRESEKSKYLPHRIRVQKQREERERQAKNAERTHTVVEGFKFISGTKSTSTTSNSRANRANNRRLVNDINTQKTMTGAEGDAMRFNQLKKRKKLVKFDRSAIHNWGLYAQENIVANDMIIEYVGEKVRQRVADLREKKYDMQGVGSSYLFRIDEDTVIDATKMGGIARFINHSCTPNCTAKIIRVDGSKRIVIYALRDIGKDEELTYDYKFERELDATDRIPCLCGSVGCKGFLN